MMYDVLHSIYSCISYYYLAATVMVFACRL